MWRSGKDEDCEGGDVHNFLEFLALACLVMPRYFLVYLGISLLIHSKLSKPELIVAI